MKAKYWVPIAIVATTAASAGVLVWLWDWFRTQSGLFTLEGIGIVFQLTGVALVVRDLRRGIAFTRNVDTYDHMLSEIEKIAQDIAPDIHPVRFKKALTEARSRVVQDDLVGMRRSFGSPGWGRSCSPRASCSREPLRCSASPRSGRSRERPGTRIETSFANQVPSPDQDTRRAYRYPFTVDACPA